MRWDRADEARYCVQHSSLPYETRAARSYSAKDRSDSDRITERCLLPRRVFQSQLDDSGISTTDYCFYLDVEGGGRKLHERQARARSLH